MWNLRRLETTLICGLGEGYGERVAAGLYAGADLQLLSDVCSDVSW